jgi:hypothetical protein
VVPTVIDSARPTNWTGTSTAPDFASLHAFPGLVERFGLGVMLPMPARPMPHFPPTSL